MNVVVIAAHGLNCHWLGPYGNEWISTPAFDQLACESVAFDRHFAGDFIPSDLGRCLDSATIQSLASSRVNTVLLDDRRDRTTSRPSWSKTYTTDPARHSTPGDALVTAVETALSKLAGREPWLLWIETERLIPPWDFEFETYQQYAEESGGFIEERETENEAPVDEPPNGPVDPDDESLWHRLHNSFAAAVTSFDSEIAAVTTILRSRDLDKSATWIFTSGHGWPLGEHGIAGPRQSRLHEEFVHLPLLIRLPEARHAMRRVSAFTQSPDLSPMILGMFGNPVTGPSLSSVMSGNEKRRHEVCRISVNHGDHVERSIRTTDWAYLAEAGGQPARLYRKPDDIWEVNDLSLRYPDDCDQLLALLNQKEQT
jgi:arylsulfatase A-like enzyme